MSGPSSTSQGYSSWDPTKRWVSLWIEPFWYWFKVTGISTLFIYKTVQNKQYAYCRTWLLSFICLVLKMLIFCFRDLCNFDEQRVGVRELNHSRLAFESRFESGNLRKAIQVGSLLEPIWVNLYHLVWLKIKVSKIYSTFDNYNFNFEKHWGIFFWNVGFIVF